jgi:uncharacterized membrane protein
MQPSSEPNPLQRSDPTYVNAMAHFYRGELGRTLVWRERLDATTTWSITTTTTIITVAFSFREAPHIIFFFNLAVLWILLWIEARRYRFYDAYRARVRMLEAHFLVPIVSQSTQMLEGDWRKLVCEDLVLPAFKISAFEAVGRRLKRNYIFLFLIIQIAWLTKIFMHAPAPVDSWRAFYQAFAVGHIPSWVVATVFVLTFISVVTITIYASLKSSGEFHEFGARKALWRF